VNEIESGDLRDGMPFLGGRLWIDFVNSAPAAFGDFLATEEGWARWRRAAGLSADGPAECARAFRAHLGALFEAMLAQKAPPAEALAAVNRELAEIASHRQLEQVDGALRIRDTPGGPIGPLGTIALDFADFVGAFEPHRMRHCSGPECTLVFYDTARNATRRWCSMALCGNRHKVRNHRARQSGLRCD
jgi:predicted RNA-binding Zn ribbon-like protein